jgi:hypothetical protein
LSVVYIKKCAISTVMFCDRLAVQIKDMLLFLGYS